MRTLILAFAAGIVLADSVHAAPPAPQSKAIELGTTPRSSSSGEAADLAGTGTIGKTSGKPAKGPLR
jgi:hypothetical protein